VPVTGVIQFDDNTIVEWRDYCDDGMRDHRPADSESALA
jgi:limonene-1,2-epoxide hydrolase